jgi:hypothetical protein
MDSFDLIHGEDSGLGVRHRGQSKRRGDSGVRGDVASCKLVAFLWLLLSSILVPTCCVLMSNLST